MLGYCAAIFKVVRVMSLMGRRLLSTGHWQVQLSSLSLVSFIIVAVPQYTPPTQADAPPTDAT